MANRATVRLTTDSLVQYRLRIDSVTRTVTFVTGPDPAKNVVLAYTMPDAEHLVLRGRLAGDSVDMRFKRRSEQSYLLVNRGFHLVNEAVVR